MKRMGERNYYLQDELGSPLRLEDSEKEQSKRAMDTEPLGKTCIRTRGRYSRLAIRATRGIVCQERTMPRQGISGREWQVCRARHNCWYY